MTQPKEVLPGASESLCPVCLERIPAHRVRVGDDVYLHKVCPQHGEFRVIIWRGHPGSDIWEVATECTPPLTVLSGEARGCPYDCGVCPEHKQQACCVLVEVTSRCNQHCPYCFADTAGNDADPPLEDIKAWLKYLIEISEERPFNIQLSGGEPTVRDDLPEIISAGKAMGLPYIQLNTNGRRLAEDEDYVVKLRDAGLSCVFLQFDGTEDAIYQRLRGETLLAVKVRAVENCAKYGLGTVLVPTLVPGVNTDNIGAIIDFAVERLPAVRGVHFQPVSYFGRYETTPTDADRITLPEVMRKIAEQTGQRIKVEHLRPLQSGAPSCSFTGNFIYFGDGKIVPHAEKGGGCCCSSGSDKSAIIKARDFVLNKWVLAGAKESDSDESGNYDFSAWDDYLRRIRDYGFSISCMAFQDVWNVELDRLQKCSIQIFDSGKKQLIPFCAYNLTAAEGKALYRR